MWNKIYDTLVQFFAGLKWSAFMAQNNNDLARATRLRNLFKNDLYASSGMLTFFLMLILVLLYYFVLNRKGGSGYAFKIKYYFMVMFSGALTVSLVMLYVSQTMTRGYSGLHPFKYCLGLALTNLLYSMVLFFLLSILFKRASVANTTPF
ncbi:hypothetical protein [Pedobacter agri]|uniref:hypothetical protein n=1 Tax=Pedobacter agri TaxID=454586 RepID=UPI00292D54DB|nr:hypothetical protein [Pedobacter agri]